MENSPSARAYFTCFYTWTQSSYHLCEGRTITVLAHEETEAQGSRREAKGTLLKSGKSADLNLELGQESMIVTTRLLRKEEGRKRERERQRGRATGRKTVGGGGKEERGDWSWVEMCTPESACPVTGMSWPRGIFFNFFLANKCL